MTVASVFDLVDTSTILDDGTMGLTGRRITGVRVALEWCARAIFTRRGSMRWARGEGACLTDLENADFSVVQLGRIKQSFDAQIQKVDFVAAVSSTLTVTAAGVATYAAAITIFGAGTYSLAVTVDQAGAALAAIGVQ